MKTYMFPGQGSQFRGMGEALFEQFSETVEKADDILGYSIKELCLSDKQRQLHKTQYTQPAMYVVNALSYRKKINEIGEQPDYLIGHSLGEYNALEAAGAITFEDGLKLVKKRGELMSQVSKGAMAAVLGLTEEAIKEILHDNVHDNGLSGIEIANYNSSHQLVLSGLQEDIRKAEPFFASEDIKYLPLNANGAFHSRYMEPSKLEFEAYLKLFTFSPLKIPVISNVYARPYKQTDIALNLAAQITHPVKWLESIHYLLGQPVAEQEEMAFEELGVGDVLEKLIKNIKQDMASTTVETSLEGKETSLYNVAPVTDGSSAQAGKTGKIDSRADWLSKP